MAVTLRGPTGGVVGGGPENLAAPEAEVPPAVAAGPEPVARGGAGRGGGEPAVGSFRGDFAGGAEELGAAEGEAPAVRSPHPVAVGRRRRGGAGRGLGCRGGRQGGGGDRGDGDGRGGRQPAPK